MCKQLISCPICKTNQSKFIFNNIDRMNKYKGSSKEFSIWHCTNCGAYYYTPRLDNHEIMLLYNDDYLPYQNDYNNPNLSLLNKMRYKYSAYKQVQIINKYLSSKGSALDVGTGNGNFILSLKKSGWDVVGTEINKSSATQFVEKYVPIYYGDLVDINFHSGTFDLITFWDVIEHIDNPINVLTEAARISKKNGYLLISMPDPESIEAKIFKKYWAGWDIPRHVWLASEGTMKSIFNKSGWTYYDSFCSRGRSWLFTQSVRFFLEENVSYFTNKIIIGFLNSILFDLFMLPIFNILEKSRRGSIRIYIANKRSV